LDSAHAEQTLLDQRLFVVSATMSGANVLERPAQSNDGLRDLFSRKAPWDTE
jgi:uncharacterized protein (DUF1778 family)